MSEQEKHELDVDFEVIEDPEDLIFPRLPNVISHRGHRVKIIATVRDVPHPEGTTQITLSACVNVLHNVLINERGHTYRPFQLWGQSKDVKVTFPSEEHSGLPFTIEAIVRRSDDDDHLGQGPDYEASAEVRTSSSVALVNGAAGGPVPQDAPAGGGTPTHPGTFVIPFTAK